MSTADLGLERTGAVRGLPASCAPREHAAVELGRRGVGLALGLSIAVITAAAALDLLVVFPDALRWMAFVILAMVAGYCLFGRVVRPLLRWLPLPAVALRIEKLLPGIHNRLVTAVELGNRKQSESTQPFFAAIVRQAADHVADFQPAQVVDRLSMRRALIWLAVPSVILIASWFASPRFVGTALARVLRRGPILRRRRC